MLDISEILTICFSGLLLLVIGYDIRDLLTLHRLKRCSANRQGKHKTPDNAIPFPAMPAVDVVIPIYNMGRTLERTVASIEKSSYPKRRLIVIDDGSDDGETPGYLDRLADRIDRRGVIPHAGKFAAANHGAGLGTGELILFLDADSYVTPDFIEQSIAVLQADQTDAVDFVQQVANPKASFWTRMAAFEREILGLRPDNFGALFAVKRKTLEQGGFVDCLSPQFEMNQRLLRQGKLSFSPRKVVYSDEPAGLRGMYRRKRRWAYGLLETLGAQGATLDFHVLISFVDLFLLASLVLVPFVPWLIMFPSGILVSLSTKALLLGRLLGFSAGASLGYVAFMLVLSSAVVEAAVRFKFGGRVAWR